MENLQELEQKYKELGEQIEKLKKNESKKRCRKSEDEEYYYIDDWCDVRYTTEDNSDVDKSRFEMRNYFNTKEEAKKVLERIETHCMLQDIADELNEKTGETIDWENSSQNKHYLFLNCRSGEIGRSTNMCCKDANTVYCLSDDFKIVATKKIGEERLIRYLKGE